jgi:hypothetical protein
MGPVVTVPVSAAAAPYATMLAHTADIPDVRWRWQAIRQLAADLRAATSCTCRPAPPGYEDTVDARCRVHGCHQIADWLDQ